MGSRGKEMKRQGENEKENHAEETGGVCYGK